MRHHIYSWLSWILSVEAAAMFFRPGLLLFTLLAMIVDTTWLWKIWILMSLAFIFHTGLLAGSLFVHRRNSRKKGLRYYFAVPIHPAFLRLMLRNRMTLSENATCYILHVDDKVRRHSEREAIRYMHNDIQKLQDDWGKNTVFVGNTFADLGSRERKWIEQLAKIEVVKGKLIPFHPLVFRLFLKRHQRRVLGRTFPVEQKKWKIIMLTQNNKPSPALPIK